MALLDGLLAWVRRSLEDRRRAIVHRECRRCGKTMTDDQVACPSCGSSEIADIQL